MNDECELELDWTEEKLKDLLEVGSTRFREELEANDVDDDEESTTIFSQYTDDPEGIIASEDKFNSIIVNAFFKSKTESVLSNFERLFFTHDEGEMFHNLTVSENIQEYDAPITNILSAREASPLNFGKDGMNMMFGVKLVFLAIILFLNWLAWKILWVFR